MEHSKPQLPDQQQADLVPGNEALPAHVRQLGKAVAVSLVALAAEASIAWLRRRVDRLQQPPAQQVYELAPSRRAQKAPRAEIVPAQRTRDGGVVIHTQRVTQVWEQGALTRETFEHTVWRRDNH